MKSLKTSIFNQIFGNKKTVPLEPVIPAPSVVKSLEEIKPMEAPKNESIPLAEVSSKIEEAHEIKLLPATHEPKALLNAPPIISFNNVTKIFGSGDKAKIAIKDVTFDIHDIPNSGELISIVGPSGCGKSTILRIIAGLTPQFPHTSGTAMIMGHNIVGAGIDRGVVDQKYSLLPHLTVVENVAFGLKLNGVGRRERISRAKEWVRKVDLEGSENKFPHELSGGMQQRVSLAATLILEPQILLMDEPFGALDPKTRLRMQELLVNLWKELEATVLIVTHSMEEAVYLGDRIFRMESNPGRLIEILDAPRPDCSPEVMRKQKWFSEIVQELLQRIENGSGKSGKLYKTPPPTVIDEQNKQELDLFKLVG